MDDFLTCIHLIADYNFNIKSFLTYKIDSLKDMLNNLGFKEFSQETYDAPLFSTGLIKARKDFESLEVGINVYSPLYPPDKSLLDDYSYENIVSLITDKFGK